MIFYYYIYVKYIYILNYYNIYYKYKYKIFNILIVKLYKIIINVYIFESHYCLKIGFILDIRNDSLLNWVESYSEFNSSKN